MHWQISFKPFKTHLKRISRCGQVFVLALLVTGCSPSPEEYAAVHQIVTDPIIFYLGGSLYLTKERNGDLLLIRLDVNHEVTEVKKLF